MDAIISTFDKRIFPLVGTIPTFDARDLPLVETILTVDEGDPLPLMETIPTFDGPDLHFVETIPHFRYTESRHPLHLQRLSLLLMSRRKALIMAR